MRWLLLVLLLRRRRTGSHHLHHSLLLLLLVLPLLRAVTLVPTSAMASAKRGHIPAVVQVLMAAAVRAVIRAHRRQPQHLGEMMMIVQMVEVVMMAMPTSSGLTVLTC